MRQTNTKFIHQHLEFPESMLTLSWREYDYIIKFIFVTKFEPLTELTTPPIELIQWCAPLNNIKNKDTDTNRQMNQYDVQQR